MVVGYPAAAEQRAEILRAEEVALDLVLEIDLPVETDRARDVGLAHKAPDSRRPRRSGSSRRSGDGDPIGLDKDILRVLSHCRPPGISGRLLSILGFSVYRGPPEPPSSALLIAATAATVQASTVAGIRLRSSAYGMSRVLAALTHTCCTVEQRSAPSTWSRMPRTPSCAPSCRPSARRASQVACRAAPPVASMPPSAELNTNPATLTCSSEPRERRDHIGGR